MKRIAAVVLMASMVALGGASMSADEAASKWDLSGTWIQKTGGGDWIASFVALDPGLASYSYEADGIWDPTVGGLLPVTEATAFHGQCDRTGSNSFKCTQMAKAGTADHQLFAIFVSYEAIERNKDGTFEGKLDACIYGFWQDPFGDEYPAFGCSYGIPRLTEVRKMSVRDVPVR